MKPIVQMQLKGVATNTLYPRLWGNVTGHPCLKDADNVSTSVVVKILDPTTVETRNTIYHLDRALTPQEMEDLRFRMNEGNPTQVIPVAG